MKKIFLTLMCMAGLVIVTACGGGNASSNTVAASDDGEAVEAAAEQTDAPVGKAEQKADAKKWYEGDFILTHKMYMSGQSLSRTYVRKGNILFCPIDGNPKGTLFVCTDSTRTGYLVNALNKSYAKLNEKTGFKSVDDAIYKYMKSQLGDNFFKVFRPGDEGCTSKDTIIFGRPAYIITKEVTSSNVVTSVQGKAIMHVDKENGLPYYKWNSIKSGNEKKVINEGVEFEVTHFSDHPNYEGLIVSLDGMTEITR